MKLLLAVLTIAGATAFAPSALTGRRVRSARRMATSMEHETGVTCTGEKVHLDRRNYVCLSADLARCAPTTTTITITTTTSTTTTTTMNNVR